MCRSSNVCVRCVSSIPLIYGTGVTFSLPHPTDMWQIFSPFDRGENLVLWNFHSSTHFVHYLHWSYCLVVKQYSSCKCNSVSYGFSSILAAHPFLWDLALARRGLVVTLNDVWHRTRNHCATRLFLL
jgi:hypothetical protein